MPMRFNHDIWRMILAFLVDPRDILMLRMTSRDIHRLTLERLVWLDALKTQCILNNAPLCTFPFDKMNAQLMESTALQPFRSLAKFSSYDPLALRTSSLGDYTEPPPRWSELLGGSLGGVWLVPGGRYIMTYTRHRIVVWDLGDVTQEKKQISMVSAHGFVETLTMMKSVEVLRHNVTSKVRFVFLFQDYRLTATRVRYFDVDLCGPYDSMHPEQATLENPFAPRSNIQPASVPSGISSVHVSPRGRFVFRVWRSEGRVQIRDLLTDRWGLIQTTALEEIIGVLVSEPSSSDRIFVHVVSRKRPVASIYSYDACLFENLESAEGALSGVQSPYHHCSLLDDRTDFNPSPFPHYQWNTGSVLLVLNKSKVLITTPPGLSPFVLKAPDPVPVLEFSARTDVSIGGILDVDPVVAFGPRLLHFREDGGGDVWGQYEEDDWGYDEEDDRRDGTKGRFQINSNVWNFAGVPYEAPRTHTCELPRSKLPESGYFKYDPWRGVVYTVDRDGQGLTMVEFVPDTTWLRHSADDDAE